MPTRPTNPLPDPLAALSKALTGAITPPPHRLVIKLGGPKAAEVNAQRVRYLGNRASRRRRG